MNKTDKNIFLIIITFLFVNLFLTVWENIDNIDIVLVISTLIVGLLIYNELFYANRKDKIFVFTIFIFLSILLSVFLDIYLKGFSIKNYYFIIMYQIYNRYNKKISISIITMIIIVHLFIEINLLNNIKQIILVTSSELGLFSLIIIIIVLLNNIIKQNKKLINLQNELIYKNLDIERTHQNLIDAYNKLEEFTIINERSNIARNMHDTVGHTLTTALVELEVTRLLLDKKSDETKDKLSQAIEQVRKGLSDLRKMVKSLKDKNDYYNEIHELVNNTIKHAGVSINAEFDDLIGKKESIIACVYRILQEGLTNGIKHGNASAFIFKVKKDSNVIKVILEDNGKGAIVLNKGFGINAMVERVNELRGTINFEYEKGGGFGIYVVIPIKEDIDD